MRCGAEVATLGEGRSGGQMIASFNFGGLGFANLELDKSQLAHERRGEAFGL